MVLLQSLVVVAYDLREFFVFICTRYLKCIFEVNPAFYVIHFFVRSYTSFEHNFVGVLNLNSSLALPVHHSTGI